LIFVAVVLTIPALLSHLLPVKKHFDSRPLERLRARRPNVVLISDSMLDNGVDTELMGQQLGGRRVELLWHGGAATAAWYFKLKNYVIASGVHPDLVCILFRDWMLTDATFRTTGTYRSKIEAAMHEGDPVYRLLLGDDFAGKQGLERWINRIYPLNARRHVQQEKIERALCRLISVSGLAVGVVERKVNEAFAMANLRAEATEEASAVSKEEEVDFDPDPGHSFLPHIVDLAAQARIPLCFLRVKRYPAADGHVAQSERLRRYVADLRAWIESRGCVFIDDTDNLDRTQDMFLKAGDDHMGPWAKRRSTELYGNTLRPILFQ